ncbi:MAG: hypothetical protein LBF62_07985 [Tannerellaceae bacterium]|jgi:hypothetical protein|nr:hypothetical protein [Tannerellaceae bacterium]
MNEKFSFLMKQSLVLGAMSLLIMGCSSKTSLDSFNSTAENSKNAIANPFAFNGYTNHWQDVYQQQYRYGNLYKINIPDLEKNILQSKRNIAEAMGIAGLQMQEGFFSGLATSSYTILDNPPVDELQVALGSANDILVFADRASETGEKLNSKVNLLPSNLNSHQMKAEDYSTLDAFILKNGKKTLYVVLGKQEQLNQFKTILANTEKVLKEYDLERGWFSVETSTQTVSCSPGNPIELIGKGMNEGNSWFVFAGGYEFYAKDKIEKCVKETNIPVVTDMGYSSIFGCDDYDGLQVQLMSGRDYLKFAREKNGYLFRNVANTNTRGGDDLDFDGYFVNVGNAIQINQGDKPFVIRTGRLLDGTINSMILFNRKGDQFDRKKMWGAIMDRRAVAVAEDGIILGPDLFRKAMQLLLLDRDYIEEYFGDKVNINVVTEGHQLHVTISNLYPHAINGTLVVKLPGQLSLSENQTQTTSLQLPANSTKNLVFEINPSAEAMEKLNAVVVQYDWNNSSKSTVAALNLPPAISVHQLLYGTSSGLQFPVTIHNIIHDKTVAVKLTMTEKDDSTKVVYSDEQTIQVDKDTYKVLNFDIKQDQGNYIVKTEAMGVSAFTQLGINNIAGTVTLKEVDLNNDGINEYQMENDHVRVTLLTTGARVIEYFVKAKNDNVFFKLWPEKPDDLDRPNRLWAFYPYGGFEDFLGQASVETHKVYDATVIKGNDDYAQIKMTADFYGNKIEKIFSLYGNSPLLEIRFALNMINPEMNVLGPQPILSLGKAHGVEDKYIIPEIDGIHEYVMNPERMYGKILNLKEGWNAGYDTRENISFVGAYPVRRPYYLHMWFNLSSNGDSHYPYTELQPWLPLYLNTTSYFSYYMWASAGSWEKGLKELRDRNLITTR